MGLHLSVDSRLAILALPRAPPAAALHVAAHPPASPERERAGLLRPPPPSTIHVRPRTRQRAPSVSEWAFLAHRTCDHSRLTAHLPTAAWSEERANLLHASGVHGGCQGSPRSGAPLKVPRRSRCLAAVGGRPERSAAKRICLKPGRLRPPHPASFHHAPLPPRAPKQPSIPPLSTIPHIFANLSPTTTYTQSWASTYHARAHRDSTPSHMQSHAVLWIAASARRVWVSSVMAPVVQRA